MWTSDNFYDLGHTEQRGVHHNAMHPHRFACLQAQAHTLTYTYSAWSFNHVSREFVSPRYCNAWGGINLLVLHNDICMESELDGRLQINVKSFCSCLQRIVKVYSILFLFPLFYLSVVYIPHPWASHFTMDGCQLLRSKIISEVH